MRLGRPIKCFKGISTTITVEESLKDDSGIEIRSMSPPSVSSWYQDYHMGWCGAYSVRGVGVWQEHNDSKADEKGFFVGQFHMTRMKDSARGQNEVITVLEGYVTIRTGGTTDPEVVFRLATWESVQQYSGKPQRTTEMVADLPLLSKWTCTTDNRDNYRFTQLDCKVGNSSEDEWQVYQVYPIGAWNQFSSVQANVYACRGGGGKTNTTMNVNDYYQDARIQIRRHTLDTGNTILEFEAYGSPPILGFYVGPAKLHGCDRAVSHQELPYVWQDMRIGKKENLWLANHNALIGMPDFQTMTTVSVNGSRFEKEKSIHFVEGDCKITQVFKSHNRELQSFELNCPGLNNNNGKNIILDVLGTNVNTNSMLHDHTTGLSVQPSFGTDPDGIICLLVPEDNCIVQRTPVCYVHINGTPTKVNVQFPLDVLIGPDFTIVGNAFYTGSVHLIYMSGRPHGAPSTVHGNIFPVVVDSGKCGKPSASCGRCSRIPAVVITIVSMCLPLAQYARMVEVVARVSNQEQVYFEPRRAVAVVSSFSVWFGYGTAAGSLEDIRDVSLKTFAVFSTCNSPKGCLNPGNNGTPDTKRLALITHSFNLAKQKLLSDKLAFVAPNSDSGMLKCYLFKNKDKHATWMAQGFWAASCAEKTTIYFMPGPSFDRQVNVCWSRRDPSETVIEANIYGLAFTSKPHISLPMVLQPICEDWTADGISIKGDKAFIVNVNGKKLASGTKYYMLSPMFTANHLLPCNELRDIGWMNSMS